MKKMVTRTTTGLLTFVLCAGLVATGAQAESGGKVKTKVRMKMKCNDGTCERERRALTSGSFTGKVKSSADECVKGRTVKVIRRGVSPGPIDSVKAAANGKWTIESDDLLPGTYFAKAAKTSEGGMKCKAGKSKRWSLEFNRSPARAHKKEFKTTLTIRKTASNNFRGKVKSETGGCVKRRLVILYSQEGSNPPNEIGRDRSDRKGKWKIPNLIGDGYYAETEEKIVKRGDHKHTCLFDRSPTTPFRR